MFRFSESAPSPAGSGRVRFLLHKLMFCCACFPGCATAPEAYPPPVQRMVANPVGRFVDMNHPSADAHVIRDVQDALEGIPWRWTYRRPELRFFLDSAAAWKFVIDFSLPATTFSDTGPVTVSFYVNGQLLDRVRYTSPGNKRFQKPVPPSWLESADPYTVVAAEIDPPWTGPGGQPPLGFLLHRAGFVE